MGVPAIKMTLAEYLAAVETSEERLEWINGEVYAMAGGRPLHAAVGANAIMALGRALDGCGCRVASPDQRVYVEATEASVYPDATVVCGPYRMAEVDRHAIVNPSVVVEVISPSTEDYDRGAKLEHYLRIPTLGDVLIIDPDRRLVTHHSRTTDGWLRRDHTDGDVVLTSVPARVSVARVFADLENVPTT
jgi:Uma2 family endonuclease